MEPTILFEDQFEPMPENSDTRPAQIAISRDRFYYLVKEYKPSAGDEFVMFWHPDHFVIYENATRQCLFDANVFLRDSNDNINEDDVVAVVNKITINKEVTIENEFELLANLIEERL